MRAPRAGEKTGFGVREGALTPNMPWNPPGSRQEAGYQKNILPLTERPAIKKNRKFCRVGTIDRRSSPL
jgi:hypothetical protein